MARINDTWIYLQDEKGHYTDQNIAEIHSASEESVKLVLGKSEDDEDGRSQWMWVRLQNGDLILGVFPQGDTYFACEVDAETPR